MSAQRKPRNDNVLKTINDSFQNLVEVMDPGQPGYRPGGPVEHYVIRLGDQKSVSAKYPLKAGLK